jgi:hypothetical protein
VPAQDRDAADFTAAGLASSIARGDIRELVISSGGAEYVALYRIRNVVATDEILTIRHQREAGYRE